MNDVISPSQVARIDSPLGDAIRLRSMTGVEAMSHPFAYDVDVVSDRSDIAPSELVGKSVTILLSIGGDEANVRHWNGRATRLQYAGTDDQGVSSYRLTLRPWFWLLSLCADCRIFQNMTIPDIVTKVFQGRGFDHFRKALFGEYTPREYIVQYQETDFEFVCRLLERAGIYYFFEHHDDKHVLVLADSPSAHKPAAGAEPLPYMGPDRNRDATTEYVRRWTAEAVLESSVYAQGDYDYLKPRSPLLGRAMEANAELELEFYGYPGGFATADDATTSARLRLEQARSDARRWTGETNARNLVVGAVFDLIDHPRRDQDQEYLITSCRYQIKIAHPWSGLDIDDPFDASFVAIPSGVTFRPPFTVRAPVAPGPQTAFVIGPEGKEIWTDALGRVMVKFHWDRREASGSDTCWIRVSQAWAGPSYGAIFVPRIGQEVVVDFLGGDPEKPIITGVVYNGCNQPPFDLAHNETQSGIASRSTPKGTLANGNMIRFEDLRGHEELYLQAERDQRTFVKGSQSIAVLGDRARQVHGDDATKVDGKVEQHFGQMQTTQVTTDRILQVGNDYLLRTTDGSIVVTHGDSSIAIAKGEDTTIVTKNASILVSQTGDVKITNGGGSLVMLKDGTAWLQNTSGALTISQVDNEIALTDGKISIQAKGEVEVKSTGTVTIEADDKVDVRAKQIGVTGTSTVTIGVGGSSVELSSAGATVRAPIVELNA